MSTNNRLIDCLNCDGYSKGRSDLICEWCNNTGFLEYTIGEQKTMTRIQRFFKIPFVALICYIILKTILYLAGIIIIPLLWLFDDDKYSFLDLTLRYYKSINDGIKLGDKQ